MTQNWAELVSNVMWVLWDVTPHNSQPPHEVGEEPCSSSSHDTQVPQEVGAAPCPGMLHDSQALHREGAACAVVEPHAPVVSELEIMTKDNEYIPYNAQWAGVHALTPASLRLLAAIESIAKFAKVTSLNAMF